MLYKEAIDLWTKSLYKEFNKYGNNKKMLIVSIARKGPRLCELSSINEDVISEHAIPFSLPDFMNSLVVLTDEAIYFGTTFQRIYAVLRTGIRLYTKKLRKCYNNFATEYPIVKAAPVIISHKANLLLDNKLEWLMSERKTIADEYIPLYINNLIENFYSLGKPFDIEFPILYVDFPKEMYEMSNQEIARVLKCKFKNIEPERGDGYTYILEHRTEKKDYYTVTRLFSDSIYQNNRKLHSDFSKMRAFWLKDKKRIALTFYSPHIIDDKYLIKDTPLFTGTPYAKIWSMLWQKVSIIEDAYELIEKESVNLDFEKRREIEYNMQEYKYHVKRSLLIWANYLYSYDMAMGLLSSLKRELFDNKTDVKNEFVVEERDICYLAGKGLAKDITSLLNTIAYQYSEIQMPVIPMDDVRVNNYIPEAYQSKYEMKNARAFLECNNMSELISMIFYNMHFDVELEGRKNWREDLSRLRFGETFSSIYNRGFVGNYSDIFHSMHKAVDLRIDNGSIVPKYICRNEGNSKVWFRMFRCGENEDLYAQRLIRFIEKLLNEISEIYDNSLLPEMLIRSALAVYLTPPDNAEGVFEGVNLPWRFTTNWSDWGPQVCFLNELSDDETIDKKKYNRDLVEFCKWHGLIQDSDVKGFFRINSYLPKAVISKWNESTNDKLKAVTTTLVNMMKTGIPVLDAAEWLLYKNEIMEKSHNKLIDWCVSHRELPGEFSPTNEFILEFNNLNLTFPRQEKEISNYLQELTIILNNKRTNLQKKNLATSWLENISLFTKSQAFKEKRELGFMMYRLLMCCLFLRQESYENTLREYAAELDRYPICKNLFIGEIVRTGNMKRMRNVYKQAIERIINKYGKS